MAATNLPDLANPVQSIHEKEFILYQPNPTKQMLLYDMATSSSTHMFLKMHSLRTTIKNCTNSEFMSDNGKIPVVIEKDNDKPMCGFRDIFWHVSRGLNQTPSLIEVAYMDWIETKFLEAEMYVCWCYKPVVDEYTKARYTYDLPWPVSTILFNQKRREIESGLGDRFSSFDDFLKQFNQFLGQLNKLVGNRPFCLNEPNPSPVNALIYGHTHTILSSKLHPKLRDAITRQRRVENLIHQIEEVYLS